MNVTGTGIAVAIAVVVALGFLFFGPRILQPFTPSAATDISLTNASSTLATTTTMDETTAMNTGASPEGKTVTLADGLVVTDEVIGTGAEAKSGNTISVNYVGTLQNGTVFDASANHGGPLSFNLGEGRVIRGWEEGLVGMKEGGKRRLVIPAALAYGDQAMGAIPANSTLVFEVEMVKVQ